VVSERQRACLHSRMADCDLHDEILRLEAQIEQLTEAPERCRKAILVSKVAIAAGGLWLLAFTFGAIGFDPMAMIAAIATVIGGTVVFGSNTSTSKQAVVDIKAAEALRAELIGKINLRVVREVMVRRCVGPGRYPLAAAAVPPRAAAIPHSEWRRSITPRNWTTLRCRRIPSSSPREVMPFTAATRPSAWACGVPTAARGCTLPKRQNYMRW
jgi:hypothetical protein